MKIRKVLSRLLKSSVCLILVLSLSGCVPLFIQEIYESTVNPFEPNNFKNTKWVCNELDMYFYITDFGSGWIWGEYTVNGQNYHFDGRVDEHEIDLNLHPTALIDICDSRFVDKNGNTYLHIDDGYTMNLSSYLYFDIIYKDGILECTVNSTDDYFWEEKYSETFTLEKKGECADKPQTSWKNEELNMSFGLYEDNTYLIGEMIIREKKYKFQAYQSYDGIYEFRLFRFEDNEDYVYDYRYSSTNTLPLVKMRLEIRGDQLVAKVTDDHLIEASSYPYWNFAESEYIFQRQ